MNLKTKPAATIPPKKIKSIEMETYFSESLGLERDYINELISSRRYAWYTAIGISILTLLAIVAVIIAITRPAPDPVVLRVDNATGAVDIVTTIEEHTSTYGEAIDIYWLNKYVLNRESYDYSNIQMLYDTTALLSTPEIQQEYYGLFQGANARDKLLGENTKIIVTVKSVIPNKRGGNAIVRFTTQKKNSNGYLGSPEHLIATISYEYTDLPISAYDRRINPLGFQVISYRVDPEIISS